VPFFQDKIWTYTLDRVYHYQSKVDPKITQSFVCRDKSDRIWLTIEPRGLLSIEKDYSWDGCSPKITFGPLVMGIWDGPLEPDGKPMCYYPSLVHDAFCQFAPLYENFPYSFAQIDLNFLYMLQGNNWQYAEDYYRAVRLWHRVSLQG
jgi:hypothetical protein